jgi:putative NADH-flavin reductase
MKIAVIGASAGIGLEVVRHALQRRHEVTSLSRSVGTLPDDQRLHVVQGSSTKPEDVKRAIDGAEAILVTLGTGKSTKATTLCTDSARVLLQVLKDTGATPPLIVLTGFGAGDSWGYNSPVMKLLFNLLLKDVYADKSRMERMIAQDYPRWEMVRPGLLTNGSMTGRYRVLGKLEAGMKVGAISRADVAHFMVAEAENRAHLGQYPALSY